MQEHEPDSSISSSEARGKGKSKEEDYGKPENKENQIAGTNREDNVLELLNEMEELRKDVSQLAKMVSEIGPLPTCSYQAHGRSGVDSARKMLNEMEELRKDVSQLAKMFAEGQKEIDQIAKTVEFGPLPTGRDQAHGRSGWHSARKTSNIDTGEPSPSGGSGSRPKFGRYVKKHQGSHREHQGSHHEHQGAHDARFWEGAPGDGVKVSQIEPILSMQLQCALVLLWLLWMLLLA